MRKLLLLFLSTVLLSGGAAYAAHAKLVRSTPEDGSVGEMNSTGMRVPGPKASWMPALP